MAQKFNFKRLEEPFEADWPVTVNVPDPERPGKTTIEEFMARFRIVRDLEPGTPPAVEAVDDSGSAAQEVAVEEGDAVAAARKALRAGVIQEWRRWFVGLGKPTSEEEEFTDDFLWHIITTPYARRAVEEAYRAFCAGIPVKN